MLADKLIENKKLSCCRDTARRSLSCENVAKLVPYP